MLSLGHAVGSGEVAEAVDVERDALSGECDVVVLDLGCGSILEDGAVCQCLPLASGHRDLHDDPGVLSDGDVILHILDQAVTIDVLPVASVVPGTLVVYLPYILVAVEVHPSHVSVGAAVERTHVAGEIVHDAGGLV